MQQLLAVFRTPKISKLTLEIGSEENKLMVTVLAENGKFDLLRSLPRSKNLNVKMCWRLVCSLPARLVPLLPPLLHCK